MDRNLNPPNEQELFTHPVIPARTTYHTCKYHLCKHHAMNERNMKYKRFGYFIHKFTPSVANRLTEHPLVELFEISSVCQSPFGRPNINWASFGWYIRDWKCLSVSQNWVLGQLRSTDVHTRLTKPVLKHKSNHSSGKFPFQNKGFSIQTSCIPSHTQSSKKQHKCH